jgi:hypothetical protein
MYKRYLGKSRHDGTDGGRGLEIRLKGLRPEKIKHLMGKIFTKLRLATEKSQIDYFSKNAMKIFQNGIGDLGRRKAFRAALRDVAHDNGITNDAMIEGRISEFLSKRIRRLT